MKRIKNKKSKSGFTLLEVLLATVILTIASTMIMKGFIAVMIFANNNKGFARQASINNRMAIHKFMIDYATGNQQDVINAAAGAANHSTITMTVSGAAPAGMTSTLNVATESFTDQGGLTDGAGNPYPMNVDGTEIASTTVASNRYAFFYDFGSAYHCPNDSTHPVRYGYQMIGGSPTNFGFYCFSGCLTPDDESDDCSCYANGTMIARAVAVPTPA